MTIAEKQDLEDEFAEWCMRNYFCANGDMLVNIMEDGNKQSDFLEDMGLPEDTEIWA